MSRYQGTTDFDHAASERIGVLLVNLGTPDAPTAVAVRRYLAEFLSDPRVIELPRLPWWLLLHGIILRVRPRRVARAYAEVWTADGSPLLAISRRQASGLQAALDEVRADGYRVALAMRYGTPSIPDALAELRAQGCQHILVLPMFPQYSGATTGSVFDAVTAELQGWRRVPELRMLMHYHDHPAYIDCLASSISRAWQQRERGERLLLSFHGLPQRYLEAGDPYFCECHKTARLLAERLDLPESGWQTVFQSRFGREPWLQPYLDKTLEALPGEGVQSVDVVCPGFPADCLETLEEVAQQNRELFLASGGRQFNYLPALNDDPGHIAMLRTLVEHETTAWRDDLERRNGTAARQDRAARAQRLGARA